MAPSGLPGLALRGPALRPPHLVYTTYINTTPEWLWQGLTDPVFTRRYWGIAWESDWRAGSTVTLELDFDAGSAVLPGISEGWPRILSGLKTLLETGDTLPVR